jgi:hypothetical protein
LLDRSWQETINQYMNTKWKPKSQLTHNLSWGSLACWQAMSLLWRLIHLVVCELIGVHKPSPAQGCRKNLHEMRALKVMSNPLEVLLALHWGISPRTPHKSSGDGHEQWSMSRNHPNYKSTSTKTITEMIKLSYLNPYNSGSPMKSWGISNQPTYKPRS